jgi:hypothetical protein
MPSTSSIFIASALVGLAACSNVECLQNEEKVGSTCYPVRSTQTADAAAATASDGGPTGDGGAAVSRLDAAVALDGAIRPDANAATSAPRVPDNPAPDAASGSAPPVIAKPSFWTSWPAIHSAPALSLALIRHKQHGSGDPDHSPSAQVARRER